MARDSNLCHLLRLSHNRQTMGWLKDQTWITPSGKVVKRFAVRVHPPCHVRKRSPAIYGLYELSSATFQFLITWVRYPTSEMMTLLNFTTYADYMDWCAWVWRDAPPYWNPFESENVEVGFTPTRRAWHLWCSLTSRRGQMGSVSFSAP